MKLNQLVQMVAASLLVGTASLADQPASDSEFFPSDGGIEEALSTCMVCTSNNPTRRLFDGSAKPRSRVIFRLNVTWHIAMTMAGVSNCPRKKPCLGILKPPSVGTCSRSTTPVCFMPMGEACLAL